MAAIVIRNLDDATKRALQRRAAEHGRSMEAEARAILDAAVRPPESRGLGSEMAKAFRGAAGDDLVVGRDRTPVTPIDLA